ncbi:MAG: hypothetical protein ACM3JE_04045 [Betaproteobacteria bacterium]
MPEVFVMWVLLALTLISAFQRKVEGATDEDGSETPKAAWNKRSGKEATKPETHLSHTV